MSRQKAIHNYIQSRLNGNLSGVDFELKYKYGISDQEFSKWVFNSVNNPNPNEENEVDMIFDGVTYSTQNGVFSLDKVQYIPCIIEAFNAEFQPIDRDVDTIINYRVPVTFFVDERLNNENNDFVTEAIEFVQDSIRGRTETIDGYTTFVTHNDFRAQTGILTINERPFRRYQMVFYLKMSKNGKFGSQIQYFIQNDNLFLGETTRIYPIYKGSDRVNEIIPRQKFDNSVDQTEIFELFNIPDISAFELNTTFIYNPTNELTQHFMKKKYNPTKPEKYFINIILPGLEATPFGFDYLISDISGVEDVDKQLVFTVTWKKASVKYNG